MGTFGGPILITFSLACAISFSDPSDIKVDPVFTHIFHNMINRIGHLKP